MMPTLKRVRCFSLLLVFLGVLLAGCDTKDAVATVTARAAGTATAALTLTIPPTVTPTTAPTETPAPVTPTVPTTGTPATAAPTGTAGTPAPATSPKAPFAPTGTVVPSTATPTKVAGSPDTAWFSDAILYSVFVRSFRDSNGDGIGDLQGVIDGLDYIQSLGVNTIWLLPVFKAGSYHGYDTIDYYTVNPDYGTNDDLVRLIKEVHKRNMHILLDYVVNHTSDQHPFFKDAFKNPASQYSEYYKWTNSDHSAYAKFGGVDSMPLLNYDSQKVRKYVTDVALYWLDPNNDGDLSDGIDGWRCDVATGPPHDFWAQLRVAMTARNPKSLLLGELWTDTSQIRSYMQGNEFDAAFDFPSYLALTGSNDVNGDGLFSGKGSAFTLELNLRAATALYSPYTHMVRFVNNHDTNRLMSDVNGDIARGRAGAVWLLTAPGTPMIYYGEEIGMRGSKGPGPIYDEYRREPLDWYKSESGSEMTTWFKPADRNNKPDDGISVEEQDKNPNSLLGFYRQLGKLRNDNAALREGAYDLPALDGQEKGLYFLRRWDGNNMFLIVINFTTQQITWTNAPAYLQTNGQTYKLASPKPTLSDPTTSSSGNKVTFQPGGYAIFKAGQ